MTLEEDDPNWMRMGYDPYWEEVARNDENFAQMMKENDPDQYYSWDWTPDGPEEDADEE